MTKRFYLAAVLLVLGGLLLAPVHGVAEAQKLPWFRVGLDLGPDFIDPTKTYRTQDRYVYAALFDPFIHRAPDGSWEPRALTDWEWVSSTQLRLTVNPDVVFHDGTPMTAKDVAFTLERILDPDSALLTSFQDIEKVVQVDEYTVDVHLSIPNPLILSAMVDTVYVVPADYYEEVGAAAFANNPMGSGPFRFVSFTRGYNIVMKANENYWHGAVDIQNVEFRFISEDSTRVAALRSGELDLINYVPNHMADSLTGNARAVRGESPSIIYVGMVPSSPVFQDVRVRQAVNYAVNREATAEVIQGGGTILGGALIPGMIGYDPPLEPYAYDPARAQQLLREAGYNGREVRLDVPLGRVAHSQELGQLIAIQLQQVGLNVRINEVEFGLFSDMLYRRSGRQFDDMWIFHAKSSSMHPDDFLGRSFHTDGGWNWGKVSEPQLDEWLEQGLVATDEDEQYELYRKADEFVRDQAYYLPLYIPRVAYGLKVDARWSWEPRTDEMIFVYEDVKVGPQ